MEDLGQFTEFSQLLNSVGIPSEWAPIDVIGRDALRMPHDLEDRMQTPTSDLNHQSFDPWLPSNPRVVQNLTTFPSFGKPNTPYTTGSKILFPNPVLTANRAITN